MPKLLENGLTTIDAMPLADLVDRLGIPNRLDEAIRRIDEARWSWGRNSGVSCLFLQVDYVAAVILRPLLTPARIKETLSIDWIQSLPSEWVLIPETSPLAPLPFDEGGN